jgi:hypothetical protein
MSYSWVTTETVDQTHKFDIYAAAAAKPSEEEPFEEEDSMQPQEQPHASNVTIARNIARWKADQKRLAEKRARAARKKRIGYAQDAYENQPRGRRQQKRRKAS